MMNPLDTAMTGGDVKRPARPYQNASHIDPLLGPGSDYCPDHIARLQALDSFGSLGLGARKAKIIYVTHLPIAVACGTDAQGNDPLYLQYSCPRSQRLASGILADDAESG